MKITTCLPIYNGAKSLKEALDSLVAQTRQPDEVVVVDDASLDDSLSIVKEYESKLPMKIIKNDTNLGIIANWQACQDNATGDIVAFLHQDDGYFPEFLAEAEAAFEQYSEIGFWACMGQHKDSLSDPAATPFSEYKGLYSSEEIAKYIYLWKYAPPPTTAVFRKSAVDQVGHFNDKCRYTGEPDMYFRLAVGGYSFFQSEKVFVWRTTPETRATAVFRNECLFEDWLDFMEQWGGHSILKNYKNITMQGISELYREYGFVIIRYSFLGKFAELKKINESISARIKKIKSCMPISAWMVWGSLFQGFGAEILRVIKQKIIKLRRFKLQQGYSHGHS